MGFKDQVTDIKTAVGQTEGDLGSLGNMIPAMLPKFTEALAKWKEENTGASEQLMKNYEKEVVERRYWFNRIQELKGNIRVYCRVRPQKPKEKATGANEGTVTFPAEGIMVIDQPAKNIKHDFEFEKIFNPKSRQEDVFKEVSDLITSVLDGFNVCIFAYGQTGSGKTFTMEGPKENPGVNYRSLTQLFQKVEDKKPDIQFQVQISLLEIYNESILDLLTTTRSKKSLSCTQSKEGSMEVSGLVKQEVSSTKEVLDWLKKGAKNRHVASTSMNDASSRSHLVLSVYCEGKNQITGAHVKGKLHLVDLAGSERVGRSNVTGDQLKEAQKINYSLSALGNCIQARANKKGHVPYRDSKLTHLLQDSLEKNSKTLMVVQISPCASDVGESLCSLKFAARVRMVELGKAEKNNVKKK